MRYRELGKTGLMVSEIGLGAEWLERHNAAECKEVIDCCAQAGINLLDCWMSEPNVRANIGLALEGRREQWIIQGHLCTYWAGDRHTCVRDLKRVQAGFDDLLARLRSDYVDIGVVHYVDTKEVLAQVLRPEFVEYLQGLKAQGKVRFLGVSTHNPDTARAIVESGLFDMLLFSINPAFDMLPPTEDMNEYFVKEYRQDLQGVAPERTALYQLCQERGVGVTVMKGYAGGRLLSEKASPFGVALTPVQCLHYALTRPAVASVLAGMETPEQVAQAAAYETASEQEKDYAAVLANAPFHSFAGQCTYCGHCQPCPVHIDIAMVNKLYDLAVMQGQSPASIQSHYDALKAKAGDCIACGGCEKRCPFQVPIIARMKKARALFE